MDRVYIVKIEDDSSYPEVRSAVANTDDPEMPVNTVRVWVLGIFFAIIIPGVNQVRRTSKLYALREGGGLLISWLHSFSTSDILQ